MISSCCFFNFTSLSPLRQDLGRLFPEERFDVQVTLIEASQILSAFDEKLRNYTENLITKRESMNIVNASVVGQQRLIKEKIYNFFCF